MRLLHQWHVDDRQALLNDNPKPSEQQVTDALAGHLCRCGTHQRIVQAIMKSINA